MACGAMPLALFVEPASIECAQSMLEDQISGQKDLTGRKGYCLIK